MSVVRFEWPHTSASQVSVAGSFSNWEGISLDKVYDNIWGASVIINPGIHQYKFIVDGVWVFDSIKPNQDDGSGNFNNILNVYDTRPVGELGSPHYREYFFLNHQPVSPFHDIPLWVDRNRGIVNMIVEIPKGTHPKLEISKGDKLNPIKQDVKNGKLRFVHDPYPFNYGAFPQTWENPQFHDDRTNAKGDNDPLDVCDLSSIVKPTGTVVQVKILGTYAMIDSGETDWKIVVIDINDPKAHLYQSHTDIPQEVLSPVFTFLRDYKIPDGNPPNQFAFNSQFQGRDFALSITDETHEEWRKLISGKTQQKDISLDTTVFPAMTRVQPDVAYEYYEAQKEKAKQ
jgi:inorganic pyrophosphatase